MSSSKRFDISDILSRVQSTNRSPIEGTPLRWPLPWQTIGEMLYGWTSGMMIVAGQSNHGKSTVAMNAVLHLIEQNPELMVIDFTLDDDSRDRVSKYVSLLAGVMPEHVKMEYDTMKRLGSYRPEVRDRFREAIEQGYETLRRSGRIQIIDADILNDYLPRRRSAVPTIEDIAQIVHEVKVDLSDTQSGSGSTHRASRPMILLVIDSLHDLGARRRHHGENERLSYICSELMGLSQIYGLRILATVHARKVTNWRKPSMDDVYGASVIKYAAKVITFVYNDHKERHDQAMLVEEAKLPPLVREMIPETATRRPAPVLVWSFLKNKTTGAQGAVFLRMCPYTTRVEPVPEEDSQYYLSLYRQSEK